MKYFKTFKEISHRGLHSAVIKDNRILSAKRSPAENISSIIKYTFNIIVLVCLSCYNNILQTGGLSTMEVYFSPFWRVEVQDRAQADLVSSKSPLSGSLIT